MALRKLLSKRLSNGHRILSPAAADLQATVPPNATKINGRLEHLNSPEEKGFFRRFLHRRAVNQLPEILSIPVGEKLRESLKGINITGERIILDRHATPTKEPVAGDHNVFRISVQDARKLLRLTQMEKLKLKLNQHPENSIPYFEFVRICVEQCGNEEQGAEFANMLDQSGKVIVLGTTVFLRPEQVAKSMEHIISQSIAAPNDPRRKQLEEMEEQKALIDQEAQAQVRVELYYGLGFLVIQTLGFMRLTFWELSWDVMEPICFFVTSLHFALGYGFFLRTSIEPSFEGYFRRRFKAKQEKLMKIHNFDAHKYNELRKAFYRNFSYEHYNREVRGFIKSIQK